MSMQPKEKSGLEQQYFNLKKDKNLAEIEETLRKASPTNVKQSKSLKQILEENRPNDEFVQSYNERYVKEEEEKKRQQAKQLVNEEGKLYARCWEKEGFAAIHDPLGIWEKKGNYEDLAWKVFNDVDDENVYLKVLYYPKITSDDFHNLINKFEKGYQTLNSQKRFAYILSAGAGIASWGLAYKFRFKLSTFAVSALITFGAAKCGLDSFYKKRMNSGLNQYAEQVAENYPEIKFAKVQLRSSDQLAGKI